MPVSMYMTKASNSSPVTDVATGSEKSKLPSLLNVLPLRFAVVPTMLPPATRSGVPTDVAAKLKALERENRELRQANEILRKASAYFAQAELDRRFKL